MPLPSHESSIPFAPGDIAFFSWDLASDRVYGDAVLADLFSIDTEALASGSPILPLVQRIVEEDRGRIAESIHQAITSGQFYREQYRIRHAKRGVIHVVALGRCLKDAAGVPFVYNGTVIEACADGVKPASDPLEGHCKSALRLAEERGNELAMRYLSSALRVIGSC